jgi:thioredoxin
VLVDFYADWCGPCKMMAPFVDELAARYVGRALVAKVNTDHSQQAAAPFNIRGIPTTIVFKGGQQVVQKAGAMPLAGLEELLKQAL